MGHVPDGSDVDGGLSADDVLGVGGDVLDLVVGLDAEAWALAH